MRWLLDNDPALALDIVTVHRWNDWSDRPYRTDYGIDLGVFPTELRDGAGRD